MAAPKEGWQRVRKHLSYCNFQSKFKIMAEFHGSMRKLHLL